MDTTTARRMLEQLRTEIDTVLEAVRDTNPGLVLELGRCSFAQAGGFTFKIEGTLPGGESREAMAYASLRTVSALPTVTRSQRPDGTWAEAKSPGLELPPLGSKFKASGKVHTVTGATPRGKVYTQADGARYSWSVGALCHHYKRAAL